MIPCRTKDDVQFIVWIILWRKADFFEVKIHLDNSELCTDLSGLQSISAFQDGVFAYIATSAYFYPDSICYSIYDLSYLNIGKVKHIATETYKFSDFNRSNSVVIPKDKFNIRDFLFFGVSPIFGKENGLNDKKHFLIATWYNNGLMFFQAINLISKQSSLSVCSFKESNLFMWKDYDIWTYEEDHFNFNESSISNVSISNISNLIKKQNYHTLKENPDIMYLNLTFIYKVNNLGKIFTESEYSLQSSTFTFFSSTSSPPIVYEFVIDEYLNVNTKRIYSVKDDGQRYTGNDMITVTQKFIAFLLFDNKMLRQSIRILYRDETNFGIGHTHILLDQFRADVSVIRFLSYKESEVIYVRNIEQWSYFKINDIELVLDTHSNTFVIFDYLFLTFEVIITSKGDLQYESDDNSIQLSQNFNISFTDPTDMDIYFIGKSTKEILKNSYGYQDFRFKISDYYMGPNLVFNYQLNASYPYGSNIYLPKILNPIQDISKMFLLNIDYECLNNYISSYIQNIFGRLMISLYWIQNNFIEHIIFSLENQSIISKYRIDYPHSNFVDLFVTSDSVKFQKYKDILVIFSNEKNDLNLNYTTYIFYIAKDKIFWLDKLPFDTLYERLRGNRSIIPLSSTNIIMLVGETEKIMFIVSENK